MYTHKRNGYLYIVKEGFSEGTRHRIQEKVLEPRHQEDIMGVSLDQNSNNGKVFICLL